MAELPDLWDLAHGSWEDCSGTSRFAEEAAQETLRRGHQGADHASRWSASAASPRPTSMVRQVKSGHARFHRRARPSIADPFLPKKIEEGRLDDIRECIGCNICVTGDMTDVAQSRCTQNPTFMEEWRKGWHPERMRAEGSDAKRAGRRRRARRGSRRRAALGLRGYEVALAEAGTELGGRVAQRMPAAGPLRLGPGARLSRRPDSADAECGGLFRQPALSADEVLEFGFEHVAIATGSHWRRDGVARFQTQPIADRSRRMPIFTPDDLMDGKLPTGDVRALSTTTTTTWAACWRSCWSRTATR